MVKTVTGASVQWYNYSSLGSVSVSQRNFLPKTTFTYTDGCSKPRNINILSGLNSAEVTWSGDADRYIVYVYKVVKYDNIIGNSYTIENLEPGSNYYVRIESDCGSSSSLSEISTSFTVPIELLSFTGTPYYSNFNKWEYNLIQWSTATETNNDYFILESSSDAVNFKEIAKIAGAGSSIEQLDYEFKDYNPVSDITYYRLTQVDYDGSRMSSEIIECKRTSDENASKRITIYPNPSNGLVNFTNVENATIEVYNMIGQIVSSIENATDNTSIDLSNIANGNYIVRIIKDGVITTLKLNISK